MTSLPDVSSGATWRCVDLNLHQGKQLPTLSSGVAEKLDARPGPVGRPCSAGTQLSVDVFRRRAERYGGLDDA